MTPINRESVKEIRLALAKMHDLLKESCEAIEKLVILEQDEQDDDGDENAHGGTIDDLDEAQGSIENAMQEIKQTISTLKRIAPEAL